jgi:HK97 family phage major capsid protein
MGGEEGKKELEKLDEHISKMIDDVLVKRANDPMVKQLADMQTKYGEVFKKSMEDANKKGVQMETGVNLFSKFAMGVLKSGNDPEKALAWAKSAYPDNEQLHGYFKALTVGTPSEGGFVVPEVLSSDIIQFLYPKLAYSKLGARRIDMPNGNINLPRFDARASCSYIGEKKKANETNPVIGNVRGSAKKLAALIPISNDLIRSSNPSFDAFVRDDLVMSLQLARDYYAFYGPGGENSPAGIVTQLTSAEKMGTQGAATTPFTADVPGAIKGGLMSKNVPMISNGWSFNGWVWSWLYNLKTTTGAYIYRDEMNEGKLLGDPYVVSNQMYSSNLAAGTAPTSSDYADIFYGDWSEFLEFVQLDMELMVFKEGSYVDSAGNTVSAASQDLTVLRALSLHDFGLRHKEAFIQGTYGFKLS